LAGIKGNMPKDTNREKALAGLLGTSSVTEAAKHSGLSERTIYRYLSDESFMKDFRRARRDLVETSIGQIQAATGEAVETLKKNLTCENPAVEVRAAQIILDTATKGVELLDVLERVEILEAELENKK
jgi:hypothetical protein